MCHKNYSKSAFFSAIQSSTLSENSIESETYYSFFRELLAKKKRKKETHANII